MATSPDSIALAADIAYGLLGPQPPNVVTVQDWGADPTGNDDCRVQFQAAVDALPSSGGQVLIPPGFYLLSGGIRIPSNVAVIGSGRGVTTLVAQDNFPTTEGPEYSFLCNENWEAATLPDGDSDISIEGLTFQYWTTADNAFASLKMRYVTRLRIEDCQFIEGGNTIAIRGCEQVWVEKNYAYGFFNCAWDFWEGPGTTFIRDNYAETDGTRQFLNFNPEVSPIASSPLDVIGKRLIVTGNQFRCTGASSEPCQIEPLSNRDNGITDVVIAGNQFHRAYLVHRGYVDRLIIANNIFDDYPDPNTSVIIVSDNNGYTPKAVVISGNVITEPGTNSDNFGVIRCQVDEAVVTGNVITGTTYTGEPFYQGTGRPNQYGNYFEKFGITGRMRQGFVFSNPNDAADNFRSCIGWEDTDGDALRMYMSGDFHVAKSTNADGTVRDWWSLEANNSVQPWNIQIPTLVSALFRKGISTGLTATGTTQPGALALVQNYNEVTTTAAGTGVRLPAGTTVSVTGLEVTVWNLGANTLNVYPPTSAQIDALGTNIADTIAAGACKTYVGMLSTQYRIKT